MSYLNWVGSPEGVSRQSAWQYYLQEEYARDIRANNIPRQRCFFPQRNSAAWSSVRLFCMSKPSFETDSLGLRKLISVCFLRQIVTLSSVWLNIITWHFSLRVYSWVLIVRYVLVSLNDRVWYIVSCRHRNISSLIYWKFTCITYCITEHTLFTPEPKHHVSCSILLTGLFAFASLPSYDRECVCTSRHVKS